MKNFVDVHADQEINQMLPLFDDDMPLFMVKHGMRKNTKLEFLRGLCSIQKWFSNNELSLVLLNYPHHIIKSVVIRHYLQFLESLTSARFAWVGIDSKQWLWFVDRCQEYGSYSLHIDEAKLLQAKELQKARNRERASLMCRCKHIPLDIVEPKELFSYLEKNANI